ncbi:unnamed protein product [Macrosiphum euphorbiae]|uniref:MADF domain-containing protein n=1 Tax=Macrosiphum euphorbiae TaxID=13131 RepID=A0AAV0X4X1_9HEMI|nr:unnamed protein product [Macrosiphum euphorbiae]
MNPSKILGSLCKICKQLIYKNDKSHVCSKIEPQYSFQKILPKVQNTTKNVPVSASSSFSNLLREIEIEEQNVSSVSEFNTTNENLVESEINDDDDAEDYSKLIIAVRERHPLWDHRIPMSNRYESIKQKLWDEIYVELNGAYSLDTIKKKWKYLREKYVRQKKKPASGAGGKKKNWCHTNELQFLDDVIMNNNKTTSNINLPSDEPRTKASKRSNNDSIEESILNELRQSRPILPLSTESKADEEKHFGNYLVSLIKNIPKKKKMALQAEIINRVISIMAED